MFGGDRFYHGAPGAGTHSAHVNYARLFEKVLPDTNTIQTPPTSLHHTISTMPTATTPGSNPPTAPISHPPLPPPQTFDFLPPLHAILSRLLLPPNNGDITSPAPTPQNNNNNNNNTSTPLSPKDLATAASPIMAKIQKARNAVKELPGIEMGNEELEEIIGKLEAEVERLNGVEMSIKKAVGESLRMLEKGEKKDGQEEAVMEEE